MAHYEYLLADRARTMAKEAMRITSSQGISPKDARSVLRSAAKPNRDVSCFKNIGQPWYPFRKGPKKTPALSDLVEALWPTGRGRRFPKQLFPDSRQQWNSWFNHFWGHGSDVVHSTGYVVGSHFDPRPSGLVHDSRKFEVSDLLTAIDLTGKSIEAVAILIDMEREAEIAFYRAHQHYLHVEELVPPPYLKAADTGL